METLETLGNEPKPHPGCWRARARNGKRRFAGRGTGVGGAESAILAANAADVAAARERRDDPGPDRPLVPFDRRPHRGHGGKGSVDAALPDPVGEVVEGFRRPNGLQIRRERVPLGVVGIIYEARPDVTSDAAAPFCLKAGNAVLLRGGKEAIRANIAIAAAIRDGLASEGLPPMRCSCLRTPPRETASAMMRMNEYLDVLIPRGGGPDPLGGTECYGAGHRNRHRQLPIYVDKDADVAMAAAIAVNAKVSRPSVCNAAETLLVHADIAERRCPSLPPACRSIMWNCAAVPGRPLSCGTCNSRPPPRRTGRPSIWTISSPSGWWIRSRTR